MAVDTAWPASSLLTRMGLCTISRRASSSCAAKETKLNKIYLYCKSF